MKIAISLLVAILLPATTATASPSPSTPHAAFTQLLTKTRSAKARTKLGLPAYSKLLGNKWAKKVAAADSKLASRLDPPGGAARARGKDAGTGMIDLPVGIKDRLSGKGGSQTRRLRVASALDGGCPTPDENGIWGISGRARGEYVVTTVERAGRYDITTTLVFETRFAIHAGSLRTGHLESPIGRGGNVSVTRTQTARDRRTGKTRRTGPTTRDVEDLSTLLILEGRFDDFIDENNGDDDAPAPNRPIDKNQLRDAAQGLVGVVYLSLNRDVQIADARLQAPNTCVTLTFDTPPRISPSQAVDLIGKPHLVQGQVTDAQLLEQANVRSIELVNDRGQSADLVQTDGNFTTDKPWYRFTAPAAAWPEDQPVGVKLVFESYAGVADATILFKPIASNLYFEVIDVHGSVDATDVRTEDGSCVFTGGPQHVDIGTAAGAPIGNLEGQFGHVESPIAYTRGAYTTLLDCGADEKPCSYATESVPNQHLGVNLRQTGDGQVKLSWGFVAVQLGHSGCSLQVPDLYVDQALLETSVPVSRFQGDEPFTIENSGDQTYSAQQGISTMTGHLHWGFSFTLQRVRADGSPL